MLTETDLKTIRTLVEQTLADYGISKPRSAAAMRVHRYRQRLRLAKGAHTHEQWMARVEVYGWKCAYCGVPLATQTLVKDHAIPISRGGSNWPANLMPACGSCNARKRDKTPTEDGWRWC